MHRDVPRFLEKSLATRSGEFSNIGGTFPLSGEIIEGRYFIAQGGMGRLK